MTIGSIPKLPKIPLIKYARVAQLVEHVHINKRDMKIPRTAILTIMLREHGVVGSSPTSGTTLTIK